LFLERGLASHWVQLACFCVVLLKFLDGAGLGFDEYLLTLIVYIGITHRIERIEKAVAPARGEQPAREQVL
jgi:hypothetical protein